MRRALTILLLLAIAAAAVWTLLRWNTGQTAIQDPWRAIPERAAVVITVPDAFVTWDRFTHTAQFWNALATLPGAAAANDLMAKVMARMENDDALRQALRGTPALIAVMRNGGDALGTLFAASPTTTDGAPLRAFGELLGLDATAMAALDKGDVVQLTPDSALPTLSFCIREGTWLMATAPAMMDEALLQWKKGSSLKDDPEFAAAAATLGAGSDAHVLLRPDRVMDLAQLRWLPSVFADRKAPAQWLAMDVRTRADALLLGGLLPGPPEGTGIKALHGQQPGPLDGARVLPRNVAHYRTWYVTDMARWLNDREARVDSAWVPDLLHWAAGTVGLAHSGDTSGTAWAYFGTMDTDEATRALRSLCPNGCDTAGYRGYRMEQLPRPNMHGHVLGAAFAGLDRPWWVVLGDAVVFGNTALALQQALDAWLDGRSLAEDTRTATWWSRMEADAGSTWWCDVARARSWWSAGMRPEAHAAANGYPDLWNAIGGLTVHLSPGQRGSTHVTIGLQFAPLQEQHGPERWALSLGVPVDGLPQVVVNHTNGTREVLVQDDLFTLHLIGSTGKVLWSRPLEGPILGAVHQVDRFRNGKLQLLFNTAEAVYLVDRNGKDVGGFPLRTESRSAAPLSVFDYEGNGDLRILVPTQSGVILNVGMDGQAVKGWEDPKLKAPAACAVHHLPIRNKDHLVVVDTLGHVRILDRKGADRERARLELGGSPVVLAVTPGTTIGSSMILWQGADGGLFRGTLEGRAEQVSGGSIGTWSEARVQGDGSVASVEVQGDTLRCRVDGKETWHRVLAGEARAGTLRSMLLGEERILGVATRAERLHLFGADGRPIADTPLEGAGGWVVEDLDRDGRLELITVQPNGQVKCLPFDP